MFVIHNIQFMLHIARFESVGDSCPRARSVPIHVLQDLVAYLSALVAVEP